MEKIKIGIIGTGDMGINHINCLNRIPAAEITALCDTNAKNLEKAKSLMTHEVDIYNDYLELLNDESINSVVISTPEYSHKEIALYAFETKKNVFLEKPLANTIEDCKEIIDAHNRSGVICQIGLVYRYSNFYRKMKSLISAGVLNNTVLMWCKEFRCSFPDTRWYHSQQLTGGSIVEKDCHHFDIFNWMIDSKPKKVCAFGSREVLVKDNNYTLEWDGKKSVIDYGDNVDHAVIIIEYENGAKAELSLCLFLNPGKVSKGELEIGAIGSNGREMITDVGTGMIEIYGGKNITSEKYEIPPDPYQDLLYHSGGFQEHVEFIDCIKNNSEPFADLQIGWQSMLVAFAAEKSIKEERVIYISELIK